MIFFRKGAKNAKAAGDEFFEKGQWTSALNEYEKHLDEETNDVKFIRRVGDLRMKLGRKDGAAEAYRRTAELYTEGGFLVQAIALYKILLRLDPNAEDVGEKMAELYSRRGLGVKDGATVAAEADDAEPVGDGPHNPAKVEIPLFSELDPDSFRRMLDKVEPLNFDEGDVIFSEGDSGDSIFVVASGIVSVRRNGRELAELSDGDVFGEGAFFSDQPRNADVVAMVDTELLEIRRSDMEPLIKEHEGVAVGLRNFYRRRILDRLLADSRVFSCLPDDELRKIADLFSFRKVVAGEEVVTEGDVNRGLFVIKRGSFSVTTTNPRGGGRVMLAELGVGDIFGEVAVIGGLPRTATVAAVEEGEVLTIDGKELDPFLEDYPELKAAMETTRDERAAATIDKVLGRNG